MPITEEDYQMVKKTVHTSEDLARVAKKHPHLSYNTLVSIRSQTYQARFKRVLPAHRQLAALRTYMRRYQKGESLLTIARSVNFSPCHLGRLLLEHSGFSKHEVSNFIKHPHTIADKRMRTELEECIEEDEHQSPYINTIRRVIGVEYEYILEEKLRNANLPFVTEATLRNQGYPRTPDILLQLPVVVSGQIVTWIDSKAMFGDAVTHSHYINDQYQSYVNRFGPGLVIYWFGCVEGLNTNSTSGVLALEDFPAPSQLQTMDICCEQNEALDRALLPGSEENKSTEDFSQAGWLSSANS